MSTDTVLVTGGSGYIAGWCVARLLNDGYNVRTTIRSLARESDLRRALATVAPAADRLKFLAADLESDVGWADAAAGCRYVLHIASPLGMDAPRDPQILIRPARDGALRVLRAAAAAGVERVVMTSSVAAVAGGVTSPAATVAGATTRTVDESSWTDPTARGVSAYAQSKTLAERAAWDFIAREGRRTTLATINPAMVVGPVLIRGNLGSVQVVARLLRGGMPGIPNFGFNFVDVRDVADLHVRAMTAQEAGGQRFIASSEFLWFGDVADILCEALGPAAAKVPTQRLPDWLVRTVALFDRQVGSMVNTLSRKRSFTSEKAQQVLGWRPRPARESILDCARSLIDLRLA